MAHKSTENLIQSDSSSSTDELNNGSHSPRSVEKVSKEMFHKRKTAFVGTSSVTSPISSVTSSPEQHPIIVVGKADVHRPGLSPPKPLPRKHLTTMNEQEPMVAKRKHFAQVDDIVAISVSGESESSKSEDNKVALVNRMDIELKEPRSRTGSSEVESEQTGERKMFFARSRKNTIVTNIDEVSVKSSSRSINSASSNLKDETSINPKPLPKPKNHRQSSFEIVQEKSKAKRKEALKVKQSSSKGLPSDRSMSSNSVSEAQLKDESTESENTQVMKEKLTPDRRRVKPVPVLNDHNDGKVIGIYIHSSSELKYDYTVHRPIVRCSVVDVISGQLLRGSQKNRVEENKEIESGQPIQPMMSKGCRFISSKYPATLNVTVKGITPVSSKSGLEASKPSQGVEWNFLTEKSAQEITKLRNTENGEMIQSNFLRRLPGQICKYPNMIHKTHLKSSSKGCLVSKFSPNGQFLAYTCNSDYYVQIATVPDLKVINTLRGHTNFVYDLDWLVDKTKNSFPLHLVSASSDRTAMVWTIEKDTVSLKILPHPSFLYAAKFLVNLTKDECLFAVTGGRDCTVRVWKVAKDDFDLLQESSVEHQNYVTSIVCSMKTNNFYSSDWNGCVLEWSNQERSYTFHVTRRFPPLMTGILSIHLHPINELRLYAQLKNNLVNCLDVSSQIILNTVGTPDNDQKTKTKFTISPCGSTIYTIQWDTILMHNILSGTLQSSFQLPFVKNRKSYISHLDYHPNLFLVSASIFGIHGSVVLLSHSSNNYQNLSENDTYHQNSSNDPWTLLKNQVHPQSSELLGNIIRRIDEILHQPEQPQNETDDHKTKTISNMKEIDRERLHCDVVDDVNRISEIAPIDVAKESDSDSESNVESGGTFTIKKQSLSDATDKTFTLSNKNGVSEARNDGTYNVEVHDNSDDTTISESL